MVNPEAAEPEGNGYDDEVELTEATKLSPIALIMSVVFDELVAVGAHAAVGTDAMGGEIAIGLGHGLLAAALQLPGIFVVGIVHRLAPVLRRVSFQQCHHCGGDHRGVIVYQNVSLGLRMLRRPGAASQAM